MAEQHFENIPNASPPTDAAFNLSQSTFSNPQEFLKVLQRDAKNISPGDTISVHDLSVYSFAGPDVEGRAAAAIAVEHFAAFKGLGQNVFDDKGDIPVDHSLEIPKWDLSTDLAFSQGHTALSVAESETLEGGRLGILTAAAAAALGAAAVVESVIPVVGIPLAIATAAGAAAMVGYPVYKMATEPFAINKAANNDQQTLASWPEINGGSAKQT